MTRHSRKEWLSKNIGTFIRQYQKKAQRGVEPNDRSYDRKVEKEIKRLPPEELSELLIGDAEDTDE